LRHGAEKTAPAIVELEHPATLHGRPEIPELKLDAWHVLAGDLDDEVDAQRMAAIINHQGPPIPARVIFNSSKGAGYRVIAGPFSEISSASNALKRLKIDLDIDGIVIEPIQR
jgi:L,D-transpeptidase ErfK/SrfK